MYTVKPVEIGDVDKTSQIHACSGFVEEREGGGEV